LARQSEELKRFIDNKVGVLGHRWGDDAELAIRNFASEIVKEWGGIVRKWSREVKINIGNRVLVKKYEIDVVISDGKEMLVEVKSSCGVEEVEKFTEAVMVYEDEVG
ncbi:DUF3782 domain-containing protein, partial [Escherichia coli]|uniref:DUF3782 domain-containing protein n=1 Tax=Escherichia coli TaxID=562 RepID=UPI00128F0262